MTQTQTQAQWNKYYEQQAQIQNQWRLYNQQHQQDQSRQQARQKIYNTQLQQWKKIAPEHHEPEKKKKKCLFIPLRCRWVILIVIILAIIVCIIVFYTVFKKLEKEVFCDKHIGWNVINPLWWFQCWWNWLFHYWMGLPQICALAF